MTRRLKMKDFLGNWLASYVHREDFIKDMLEDLENKKLCEKDEAEKIVAMFQKHIRQYAMDLKLIAAKNKKTVQVREIRGFKEQR